MKRREIVRHLLNQGCELHRQGGKPLRPLPDFLHAVSKLLEQFNPFLRSQPKDGPQAETLAEVEKEQGLFAADIEQYQVNMEKAAARWEKTPDTNGGLTKLVQEFAPLAQASRDLIK